MYALWDTEMFFFCFSVVHQVDIPFLFDRLGAEKCCTDVTAILTGKKINRLFFSVRFQSGFLHQI